MLESRRFGFDVERAIYLTVLHRLCVSGSDRAAEKWRRNPIGWPPIGWGFTTDQTRMVAAHDWDMLGALQAGCAGAYVDRGAGYHPLYPRPDIRGAGLEEVVDAILARG